MNIVIDSLSNLCLATGAFFVIVGCLGLVRMPDLFTRMHAASVTDTLGAGLLLLGMALHSGLNLVSAKLVILGLMIFFTSPTATHALAKAALERGMLPNAASREDESSKP